MDESELYSLAVWSAVTGIAMLVVGFSYRMYLARNGNDIKNDGARSDFNSDNADDNNNNGDDRGANAGYDPNDDDGAFTRDSTGFTSYRYGDSLDSATTSNSEGAYDTDNTGSAPSAKPEQPED